MSIKQIKGQSLLVFVLFGFITLFMLTVLGSFFYLTIEIKKANSKTNTLQKSYVRPVKKDNAFILK
jgi:CHASE3 domain sensor protein